MLQRGRVVSKRSVIQEVDEELGAAVVDVVYESAVATGHVGGLEDKEVGGEFDEAVGGCGGVLDVYDRGVGRGVGVYGEMDFADNFLVCAGISELETFGEGLSGVYLKTELGRILGSNFLTSWGVGRGDSVAPDVCWTLLIGATAPHRD